MFIGTAVLFTLNAIIPKYPGQVILPLLKALLLIFAVYIYGFFFMSLFKPGKETIEIPTAFAVGLIFTTFFFYLVSFFRVLVPGAIAAFYIIPIILLIFIIKNHKEVFLERVKSFFNRSPLEYLPFLLPFIYAALPPSFYDSLVYHLGIPNLYLQHSGFVETPQFFFANTSIYYEISLIPAVFAGDLVPRLFHFFIGVIFLFAAADFAVEVFKIKKRNILLLLFLSMPMSVFLLSTVKNDLLSAFFIFLGVRFLLEKRFNLSALFWGFAIGIKYTNALPLIIFLVIFFIKEGVAPPTHSRSARCRSFGDVISKVCRKNKVSQGISKEKRFPFKRMVVFGLITMAVVVPILVKNYYFAKNPFFPFFSQYFNAESWDTSRYALMKADVGKMFHSLKDIIKFPYTISYGQSGFGGIIGAQFLLLVVRERLKKNWYLLLFAILTLYLGSYFTGSLRFLYIVFVFLSFYLAMIYESVGQKIVKYLIFIVISLNFITALASQEQMYRSYQLFFQRLDVEEYKAFIFPTYPGIAYVNSHAEPGARVMLVGEARNYYLKRPYLTASGIDYSILKKYLTQSESAEEFLDALRNDKIDYIILNLGEFNRLQREYHRLDENQWRKMALYLRLLQSKIVFQQKGIFVFKVMGPP
jgi:hypothetical protein